MPTTAFAQHYWKYRIFKDAFDGTRQLVATYIVATNSSSVAKDLESRDSFLGSWLGRFFGLDPARFVKEHQLRAEALLGALHANRHAAKRFGMWIAQTPPPAILIPKPKDLGNPDESENEIRLWIGESSDTSHDA